MLYEIFFVLLPCVLTTRQLLKTDTPQDVMVFENMTTVLLNCSTSAEVAWLFGDKVLVAGGRKNTTDHRIQMIIDTYINQLHIKDISSNYTGVYTCVKYNGNLTNETLAVYNVTVVEHLTRPEKVSNISVVEGSNIKLECKIIGRPEPQITWYIKKNPSPIAIGIQGKILYITNFTRECAVSYLCEADNIVSKNVTMTINTIPKFSPDVFVTGKDANRTKTGIAIPMKVFQSFLFSCTVTVNPFINITITRNNDILVVMNSSHSYMPQRNYNIDDIYEYDFFENIENKNINFTYSLDVKGRIQRDSMLGEYKCISVNEFGRDEKIIYMLKVTTD